MPDDEVAKVEPLILKCDKTCCEMFGLQMDAISLLFASPATPQLASLTFLQHLHALARSGISNYAMRDSGTRP